MSSCCSLLISLTLDSVQRMVTYEGLVCQRIRKSRNWSRLCLSGCLCLDHAPEQWQGYDCGYDPVEQVKNKGPSSKRCVGRSAGRRIAVTGTYTTIQIAMPPRMPTQMAFLVAV